MSKKNTFIIKIDNKDIILKSVTLSPDIRLESQSHYAKAFNEAYDSGQRLRVQAENQLKERGLLDFDNDQKEIDVLRKDIKTLEITLRKGLKDNRRMTKDEGKEIAFKIKSLRVKIGSIGSAVSSFLNNTVESMAENERLQYFIYACTVHADNGVRYWNSYDEFKEETNSAIIELATKTFLSSLSNTDIDYEKHLYENQWLRKMGFMNDHMQLIDHKGRLVDSEGKLINSDGRYINENGDFIDTFGNPVDKDGNLLVEDSWGLFDANRIVASENSVNTTESAQV